MESKTFYYARVSSSGQNLQRQIEAFLAMGANERDIVTDKASGKDPDRPGYKALKQFIREGDTLVITSLDRLSRTKADIKNELSYFRDNGIRVKVLDLPTTLVDLPEGQAWITDMVTNIMVEVMSAFAEHERVKIRERQREGFDAMPRDEKGRRISVRNGRHQGRPNIKRPANWEKVYREWKSHKIKAVEAMAKMNLKKSSFYKLVKEYEQ